MSEYVKGNKVERFGSVYVVERVYSLTDKEMKERNLKHRERVTLKKIKGTNGDDILDYAITGKE